MKTGISENFCMRLAPDEAAKLRRLASQTQRTRSAIIRRLLLVADLPEARQLLGIAEPKTEAQHGT